jgi:uncharacterized cupin superfamily protein
MSCKVIHAARLEVPLEPLPPEKALGGRPHAGLVTVPAPAGLSAGIWEHGVGVSTDVEVDELFVVLSGRATIEVEGGPALEVGPGDLCLLETGARTRWTVHEALRKVFVCPAG